MVHYCGPLLRFTTVVHYLLWFTTVTTVVRGAVMFLQGNLRVGRVLAALPPPHSPPWRSGLCGSHLRNTQRNIHLLLPGAGSLASTPEKGNCLASPTLSTLACLFRSANLKRSCADPREISSTIGKMSSTFRARNSSTTGKKAWARPWMRSSWTSCSR